MMVMERLKDYLIRFQKTAGFGAKLYLNRKPGRLEIPGYPLITSTDTIDNAPITIKTLKFVLKWCGECNMEHEYPHFCGDLIAGDRVISYNAVIEHKSNKFWIRVRNGEQELFNKELNVDDLYHCPVHIIDYIF